MQKNICVFCSSSKDVDPLHFKEANVLGRAIAQNGYGLVYGGTSSGLMRAVADSVADSGGKVIGVVPDFLVNMDLAYERCDEVVCASSLSKRKDIMVERSCAFVAIAGGFGTLDEVFDIMARKILGENSSPLIFVNSGGFYDGLLEFFEKLYQDRLAKPACRNFYRVAPCAEKLFEILSTHPEDDGNRSWLLG